MENRKKELVGNTAVLLIGKMCTQFINFFMLPLYTAILAPEEYGIVDLFNTYVLLLIPIVNFQADLGLFRFMLDMREDEQKQKKLLSSVLISNITHVLVYGLLFIILQGYIESPYKYFLLLNVILNVFSSTLLQFARGRGLNTVYSFASFLCALVTVLLNILLIAIVRVGTVGMFWAVAGGQIITICYLGIALKIWKFFCIKDYDKKLLKDVLKYSMPLVPTNLSWWVISASDRTIISYFISVAANGIYSVASKFSAVINTVYTVFNMAWTETVSLHIDDEDGSGFLSEMINTLYNVFFSVCIFVIAVMPFLFKYFVNQQYSDAYTLIPILVIAIFAQIVCGLFSVVFIAKKDTNENAKTATLAALINIVFNVIFIKVIGLYAAALSTFVAYFVMAIYRYFSAQKYVKIVLSKRNIIISFVVCIIVLVTYYYSKWNLSLISLLITVLYVVCANNKILLSIVNVFRRKCKRKVE